VTASHDVVDSLRLTYQVLFRLGRKPAEPNMTELTDGGFVDESSGWKAAYLVDPLSGRFAGLNNGGYTIDDSASCSTYKHVTPHTGCRCGFHMFHDRSNAERVRRQRWGSVLLQVELYGEIVRHTTGSRGAHQVVTEMWLPARCERNRCSGATSGVRQHHDVFVAVCAGHIEGGFSLIDLGSLLGIPVTTDN
jgi:hypothetical protein